MLAPYLHHHHSLAVKKAPWLQMLELEQDHPQHHADPQLKAQNPALVPIHPQPGWLSDWPHLMPGWEPHRPHPHWHLGTWHLPGKLGLVPGHCLLQVILTCSCFCFYSCFCCYFCSLKLLNCFCFLNPHSLETLLQQENLVASLLLEIQALESHLEIQAKLPRRQTSCYQHCSRYLS